MNEFRKLVYEDRSSLQCFDAEEKGSLNNLIYYGWLRKRLEIDPFSPKSGDCYLRVFNDTYYICTLALMTSDEMIINLPNVLQSAQIPSVVFPLVRLYLLSLTCSTQRAIFFLESIETKLLIDDAWKKNSIELQEAVGSRIGNIDPAVFAQRELTEDVLSQIDWKSITTSSDKKRNKTLFDKVRIKKVVCYFARSRDIWLWMCEAIKKAAQDYDADYAWDEIEAEVIDEEYGRSYWETVKVAREPYDSEGEYVLEPMKRAGVFDFCDELKKKYDEFAVHTHPLSANNTSEHEVTNTDDPHFKIINTFVKERIKKAIDDYCQYDADLALLEVTLYYHGVLKKSNSHIAFVRKLVAWNLIPDITGSDNPEDKIHKVVDSIRDKARKLPKEDYRHWNGGADKHKCERIGGLLGYTMPNRG